MARGGYRPGAGRPGWRVTAEHCLSLDAAQWRRAGALAAGAAGSWRWADGCSIDFNMCDEALALRFRVNGMPMAQRIGLERVPTKGCTAGGARLLLRCPFCGSRVQRLYLRTPPHPSAGFGCRQCQCIAYASQAEDAIERSWRKLAKARARLGPHGTRPPGMHRSTYARLRALIIELEGEARARWIEGLRVVLAAEGCATW